MVRLLVVRLWTVGLLVVRLLVMRWLPATWGTRRVIAGGRVRVCHRRSSIVSGASCWRGLAGRRIACALWRTRRRMVLWDADWTARWWSMWRRIRSTCTWRWSSW